MHHLSMLDTSLACSLHLRRIIQEAASGVRPARHLTVSCTSSPTNCHAWKLFQNLIHNQWNLLKPNPSAEVFVLISPTCWMKHILGKHLFFLTTRTQTYLKDIWNNFPLAHPDKLFLVKRRINFADFCQHFRHLRLCKHAPCKMNSKKIVSQDNILTNKFNLKKNLRKYWFRCWEKNYKAHKDTSQHSNSSLHWRLQKYNKKKRKISNDWQ